MSEVKLPTTIEELKAVMRPGLTLGLFNREANTHFSVQILQVNEDKTWYTSVGNTGWEATEWLLKFEIVAILPDSPPSSKKKTKRLRQLVRKPDIWSSITNRTIFEEKVDALHSDGWAITPGTFQRVEKAECHTYPIEIVEMWKDVPDAAEG